MSTPRVSIVVEWDNVRYYEVVRARTMLDRLLGQVRGLEAPAGAVEVRVLFDALAIHPRVVEETVRPLAAAHGIPVDVTPTPGFGYYQLKNEGARRARGEILLFVDSDVLPEDSWLRALLGAFEDDRVEVVKGASYVEPASLYGKAFALGWYFPARAVAGPLVPTDDAMVNNVAVRRRVFERFPFPEDADLYIRQCVAWTRALRAHGIVPYLQPSARVAHPPPRFWRSALVNGHDVARRSAGPGAPRLDGLRLTYWGLRRHLRDAWGRVLRGRRDVGLPSPAVPVALLLVSAYWTLWALAELVTRWAPRALPARPLR